MEFSNPSWREQPVRTAARVAESLVRRHSAHLRVPAVDVGYSVRINTDLATALGLALFRYGLRAPELIFLKRLLSPGDIFVDAGAHIGLFALVAARQVGPSGQVIAFEPASRTADVLESNARLNSFHWLDIHRCAVADAVGQHPFVELDGDAAGFSSFAPGTDRLGVSRLVDVTTLDEALAGERVRFVKLDLEGTEARALAGGEGLLSQAKPDLLIEVEPAHLERQRSSPDQIDKILARHGYTMFELLPSLTPQLRPLARSEERSIGPNVFATAAPSRLKQAGFHLVNR